MLQAGTACGVRMPTVDLLENDHLLAVTTLHGELLRVHEYSEAIHAQLHDIYGGRLEGAAGPGGGCPSTSGGARAVGPDGVGDGGE